MNFAPEQWRRISRIYITTMLCYDPQKKLTGLVWFGSLLIVVTRMYSLLLFPHGKGHLYRWDGLLCFFRNASLWLAGII